MTKAARWPGTLVPGRHERVVRAPAKINLTLSVCAKRPDGFHELRSLVVGIDWHDEVQVAVGGGEGICLQCEGEAVPNDSGNAVWRAAELLADRLGRRADAAIRLIKRIPPGSGLGGGSSDAAAVLWALNDLWEGGLDRGALAEVGAAVGSDVPLFFHMPAAIISGRGEQVQGVRAGRSHWVLLILPGVRVSTADVYANCVVDSSGGGDGMAGEWGRWLDGETEGFCRSLFNDLEEATFRTDARVRTVYERIVALGLDHVRVTGSGSGMFHLFSNRADAQRWATRIETALGLGTRVLQTLTQDPLT